MVFSYMVKTSKNTSTSLLTRHGGHKKRITTIHSLDFGGRGVYMFKAKGYRHLSLLFLVTTER